MARKRRDGVVKQLSNLSIDEVSLVDRGANQHATVAISKALEAEDFFEDVEKFQAMDNRKAKLRESYDKHPLASGALGLSTGHGFKPTAGVAAAHAAGGLAGGVAGGLIGGKVGGVKGATIGVNAGGAAGLLAGGAAAGHVVHNHYGESHFGKALDDMDIDGLFNIGKASSFSRGGNAATHDNFTGSDPSDVLDDDDLNDNIGPGGKLPATKIKGADMPPKKKSVKGGGKEINSSGYDSVGKSADFWERVIQDAVNNDGVSKHFPGAGGNPQDPNQSPFPGAQGAGAPPTMQTPGVQPMGMGQPQPPPQQGMQGMQPPGAPTGGMPQQLPPDVVSYIQQLEQALEQANGGAEGGESDNTDDTSNDDSKNKSGNPFGKSGDFGMDSNDLFLQELAKSLDQEDNREMIGKAYEAVSKAEARAVAAEEIAKSERDLRLEREFIAKAAEFDTPVPARELGPVLKRLAESVDVADFQTIVKCLTANSAANLFGEVGKRGGGDNGSILDEVNARAQEFVGKSLTPEEAVAQVFESDPRAYDAYTAERRNALRS